MSRPSTRGKLTARQEKQRPTGKTPRERPPAPSSGKVNAKEQINVTDEDSRIMPVPGGGFDQPYNAEAMVAAVTQAANDKEQLSSR